METKILISRSNTPNGKSLADMLYLDSDFSDVTLVSADNQHVSAHRAVLSANSSFLRSVLLESFQQNTFLYMGMVDFEVLQALVELIYLGHCSTDRDKEGQIKSLALQLGVNISNQSQDIAGLYDDNLIQDILPENNFCFEVDKSTCIDSKKQSLDINFGRKYEDSKDTNISPTYQIKEHNKDNLYEIIPPEGALMDITDVYGIDQGPEHNKNEYSTIISDISTQQTNQQTFHDRKVEIQQKVGLTKSEHNFFPEPLNALNIDICKNLGEQSPVSIKPKKYIFRGKIPKVTKPKPTIDMKYSCNECYVIYLSWDSLKRHKLAKA